MTEIFEVWTRAPEVRGRRRRKPKGKWISNETDEVWAKTIAHSASLAPEIAISWVRQTGIPDPVVVYQDGKVMAHPMDKEY
jgi:hypothetical protein